MIPTNTQRGQIAKFMRMEQELSQMAVAKRMKIPLRRLMDLERGRQKWTKSIIIAFCEAISKEE